MLARSSLALVVTLGVTGCGVAPVYLPANSPQIALASIHGATVYKSGKAYDLVDAVAENPRALEEAHTAHTDQTWASWLFVGGTGLLLAGTPMFLVGTLSEEPEHNTPLILTGVSLMSASVVASIVAAIMARNSEPHVLSAINIYNEDVEAKMFIRRPAPAPTGTPATPAPALR
jgi:hypothetical protein